MALGLEVLSYLFEELISERSAVPNGQVDLHVTISAKVDKVKRAKICDK